MQRRARLLLLRQFTRAQPLTTCLTPSIFNTPLHKDTATQSASLLPVCLDPFKEPIRMRRSGPQVSPLRMTPPWGIYPVEPASYSSISDFCLFLLLLPTDTTFPHRTWASFQVALIPRLALSTEAPLAVTRPWHCSRRVTVYNRTPRAQRTHVSQTPHAFVKGQ